jgi:hypothetical protein
MRKSQEMGKFLFLMTQIYAGRKKKGKKGKKFFFFIWQQDED